MFWKKKKTVDLALESHFDDNRAAFRIAPDRDNPVLVTIMGNHFKAMNISGQGVAFRAHNFAEGTRAHATIRLPSEDKIFPVVLQVVSKQRDLCRCRFTEIHEDAENLLHSYILDLQKRKIRHNQ
ncbi:MAG: PilZ domain-containing protein [Pseudomonadota bacterium]